MFWPSPLLDARALPESIPNLVENVILEKISSTKCFDGFINKYEHYSICNKAMMRFNIYEPSNQKLEKFPGLFFLAGLTSNENNFTEKAAALRKASQLKMFLICPDTSPRGNSIEGENDSEDLGTGASYYLNATQEKWTQNYQMLTYVRDELPQLIFNNFAVDPSKVSISGHSVGGHAAMYLALQDDTIFKSVSAFAPVCSLINNSSGRKALKAYLGDDKEVWKTYDAVELLKSKGGKLNLPTLIEQSEDDPFYKDGDQLNFKLLQEALAQDETKFTLNLHKDYDHSYYFIQNFIEEHLDFHHKILTSASS